jgi:hypothetical protein
MYLAFEASGIDVASPSLIASKYAFTADSKPSRVHPTGAGVPELLDTALLDLAELELLACELLDLAELELELLTLELLDDLAELELASKLLELTCETSCSSELLELSPRAGPSGSSELLQAKKNSTKTVMGAINRLYLIQIKIDNSELHSAHLQSFLVFLCLLEPNLAFRRLFRQPIPPIFSQYRPLSRFSSQAPHELSPLLNQNLFECLQ